MDESNSRSLPYRGFIEKYFSIVDKNEKVVPFKLGNAQELLYNAMTGRDLVLKARQEGISSLILALFAVDFIMMDNSRSVCIAHDRDSTVKLFERVKFFIKSYEEVTGDKIPLRYNTKTDLVNERTNSYFYVGTAGSQSFGRSATLTNIHFSEIAFYPNPEEVYLSASQAGTPRRIVIESTANGIGDFFYQMWNDSEEKKSIYQPHFFGWDKHEEYKAPDDVKIALTTEEDNMMTRFQLSRAQMAWRRIKLAEFPDPMKFQQEYPLTPEEAFISSGHPVFPVDTLVWYKTKKELIIPPIHTGNLLGYKPPTFEESKGGYLEIWKMPDPHREYIIGGDTCEGVSGGDYACAQVIDRKSLEQVALWHGRVEPDIFGREMYKLGLFYKDAMVAPERNASGLATILTLRDLYYPNLYIREKLGDVKDKFHPELGWKTDMKTKPVMIASMQQILRDKQLILHDSATLHELFSYQYDEAGSANATKGSHDDRVIALMIAVEVINRTPIATISTNKLQENRKSPEQDINQFYTDQLSGDMF